MVIGPELAARLLGAFASSDLAALEGLTAPDVVVFGTDDGEVWHDRASLFDALDRMRELGLRAQWQDDLVLGDGWLAGTADYVLPDGSVLPVRVSLTFVADRLVHGHFSVAQPAG
jgi:hypothetical protein